MYCNNDECAQYAPCEIHGNEDDTTESMYQYEVGSLGTQWSHFTSISGDCDQKKHGDTHFDSCSHFVHWQSSRHVFTFESPDVNFVKDQTFWHNEMVCGLCAEDICDSDDDLVINLCDMCEFHEGCLARYLHKSSVARCPGCDPTRCKACWRCSY